MTLRQKENTAFSPAIGRPFRPVLFWPCLLLLLLPAVLLIQFSQKPTAPLTPELAEKNGFVVWEKGLGLRNEHLLEQLAAPAPPSSPFTVTIASSYGTEQEALSLKDIIRTSSGYRVSTEETVYPFFLRIASPSSVWHYYVLTERESLTHRELYRNMWLSPGERQISLRVILWTGPVSPLNLSGCEQIPASFQEEALVLAGLDSHPLLWQETPCQEVFTIEMPGGICTAGLEYWETFRERCLAGESARLFVMEQGGRKTVCLQIFFSGQYYDVQTEDGPCWASDYTCLLRYRESTGYPTVSYYLSKSESFPAGSLNVNPDYFDTSPGFREYPLRLFEIRE